jgi:hypothetical protein
MGAEDFAFMLEAKPGSYILLGAGRGENDPMLHDFNGRHPADWRIVLGDFSRTVLAQIDLTGRFHGIQGDGAARPPHDRDFRAWRERDAYQRTLEAWIYQKLIDLEEIKVSSKAARAAGIS